MKLSVVIPAYNEAERLPPTLERIREYLSSHYDAWEIIVSDDGSKDGTVGRVSRNFPDVKFIRERKNRGKGAAVKRGMLAAEGDLVLFSDADLSTPIDEVAKLEAKLEEGSYDIVIASRALPESQIELRQPVWREAGGKMLNSLIRPISGLAFTDTQCGFKLFRREAAQQVFGLVRSPGWAFDVEALMIASALGLRVGEAPVRWINDDRSKLNAALAGPKSLFDILRFRWRHISGAYAPKPGEGAAAHGSPGH